MRRAGTPFLLISGIAGLGGLLFGYGTAIIAGALFFLQQRFALDHSLTGLLVATTLAGAALGAGVAGPLADALGRRRVIASAAVLFAAGSLLAASADLRLSLFFGRALVGLAIGLSSTVTPLYLSEITAAEQRGAIVTLNQLLITVGILVAYLVNLAFVGTPLGWRWMFGLGALPALVLLAGLGILPESPRWLLRQGRMEAAAAALERLRQDPQARAEEWAQLQAAGDSQRGGWRELFRSRLRKPLLIALALALFQQITGINVVLYYAPIIFHAAGFASTQGEVLATVGIGSINVLATLIAVRRLDRWGRRPLLLGSFAGMLLSLLILATGLSLALQGPWLYLIVAAIAAFVISFAMGIGPIFWLLIAEIFPNVLRGRAMALATVLNWLSNMLVTGVFLDLAARLGAGGTFYLYALASFLALLFTWRWVPETKGLRLEDIEQRLMASGKAPPPQH